MPTMTINYSVIFCSAFSELLLLSNVYEADDARSATWYTVGINCLALHSILVSYVRVTKWNSNPSTKTYFKLHRRVWKTMRPLALVLTTRVYDFMPFLSYRYRRWFSFFKHTYTKSINTKTVVYMIMCYTAERISEYIPAVPPHTLWDDWDWIFTCSVSL